MGFGKLGRAGIVKYVPNYSANGHDCLPNKNYLLFLSVYVFILACIGIFC
jgi:hypothetical protein